MNIHIVVIAYGLADDLRTLFTTLRSQSHNLHWHLFRHSMIPAVTDTCGWIATHRNVTYYPYGQNRGVAKSTNEGLIAGYQSGADYVVTLADDVQPDECDLDLLIEAACKFPECPMVNGMAWHENWKRFAPMEQSFSVITPVAMQQLGMFDENFFPLYCEDKDWEYRIKLAGLNVHTVKETRTYHAGHKNVATNPELQRQNHVTFQLNLAYYRRKWGGPIDQEQFTIPFNDPRFGLHIAQEDRTAPYPGYNRDDQSIVEI